MLSRALLLLATLAGSIAAQQPSVVLRGPMRGRAAQLLHEVSTAPHLVMRSADSSVALLRDIVFDRSILILDANVTVASTVRGDVVVVNGDLFLHPGADISGRAIAIGGGVYNSALARVSGGQFSFRDASFSVRETAAAVELEDLDGELTPEQGITLPLTRGFRVPEYNRVDGVVLAWGPRLTFLQGGAVVDGVASYLSARGALDLSGSGTLRFGRRWSLAVAGGRATRSNDRWIQSELVNSASVLLSGRDYRNYYRADALTATVSRQWRTVAADLKAYAGGRTERAWSTRGRSVWSLFGRDDADEGILRSNPPVGAGTTTSALAGLDVAWTRERVEVEARGDLELALDGPSSRDSRFTQLTLDLEVRFPTFADHHFEQESHALITLGDAAPAQRYAYLGGSGTIPTLAFLGMGGDHLVFLDSRYAIPIERLKRPIVGAPTLMLRHVIGAAGVDRLPEIEQNVGVRLRLSVLRVDFMIDPATGDTHFGAGIAILR